MDAGYSSDEEDIHICGTCKTTCHKLGDWLDHKRSRQCKLLGPRLQFPLHIKRELKDSSNSHHGNNDFHGNSRGSTPSGMVASPGQLNPQQLAAFPMTSFGPGHKMETLLPSTVCNVGSAEGNPRKCLPFPPASGDEPIDPEDDGQDTDDNVSEVMESDSPAPSQSTPATPGAPLLEPTPPLSMAFSQAHYLLPRTVEAAAMNTEQLEAENLSLKTDKRKRGRPKKSESIQPGLPLLNPTMVSGPLLGDNRGASRGPQGAQEGDKYRPSAILPKVYKCERCGKAFIKLSHLQRHLNKKNPCERRPHIYKDDPENQSVMENGTLVFKCGVCPTQYLSHSQILDHHSEKHPAFYAGYCKFCGKYNDRKNKLLIHLSQHTSPSIINEVALEMKRVKVLKVDKMAANSPLSHVGPMATIDGAQQMMGKGVESPGAGSLATINGGGSMASDLTPPPSHPLIPSMVGHHNFMPAPAPGFFPFAAAAVAMMKRAQPPMASHCIVCLSMFMNEVSLAKHHNSMHAPAGVVVSEQELFTRVQWATSGLGVSRLVCCFCLLHFDSPEELAAHMDLHQVWVDKGVNSRNRRSAFVAMGESCDGSDTDGLIIDLSMNKKCDGKCGMKEESKKIPSNVPSPAVDKADTQPEETPAEEGSPAVKLSSEVACDDEKSPGDEKTPNSVDKPSAEPDVSENKTDGEPALTKTDGEDKAVTDEAKKDDSEPEQLSVDGDLDAAKQQEPVTTDDPGTKEPPAELHEEGEGQGNKEVNNVKSEQPMGEETSQNEGEANQSESEAGSGQDELDTTFDDADTSSCGSGELSDLVCWLCRGAPQYHDRRRWADHMRRTHFLISTFICVQANCQFRSTEWTDMLGHARVHSQRAFVCRLCNSHHATEAELTRHHQGEHGDLNPQNFTSDMAAPDRNARSYSLRKRKATDAYAGESEDPEVPPAFKYAMDLASSQKSMRDSPKHGGEKKEKGVDLDQLLFHQASTSGSGGKTTHSSPGDGSSSKPHVCTQCDSSFPVRERLAQHIKNVHGPRKYKCRSCGAAFKRSDKLKRHMSLHSEERPYVCDYAGCQRGFKRADGLRAHQRYHDDAKVRSCSVCDVVVHTQDEFVEHMKTHHGVSQEFPQLPTQQMSPADVQRMAEMMPHMAAAAGLAMRGRGDGSGVPGDRSEVPDPATLALRPELLMLQHIMPGFHGMLS